MAKKDVHFARPLAGNTVMSKCVYDRFLCDAAGRRGIFRSVRFSTDVLAQGQGFPAFKRRSSKDVTCTTFGLKTSWARGHTHLIGQIAALRGRSGQGRHFQVSRFSADVLAQGTRLSCVQTPGSKDATDATCTPFGLKASWARGHTLITWANSRFERQIWPREAPSLPLVSKADWGKGLPRKYGANPVSCGKDGCLRG